MAVFLVCVCVCASEASSWGLPTFSKFAPTNQPATLGSIGLWHHRLLDIQGVPWTHGFSQTPSIFLDVHPCLRDLCYWQGGGFKYLWKFSPRNLGVSWSNLITLQGTNISPKNGILKMIFLLPRWDMLIPWRVIFFWWVGSTTTKRWHVQPFWIDGWILLCFQRNPQGMALEVTSTDGLRFYLMCGTPSEGWWSLVTVW